MKIDPIEVSNGVHDGKDVYICHLNIPDLHKKPLRKIPPTKVKVISENDPINKGKRVTYSNSLFQLYSAKGELTKKTAKIFDNTGYRSFRGNPVYIFDTFDECQDEWSKAVIAHLDRLKEHRESILKSIDSKINEFEAYLS